MTSDAARLVLGAGGRVRSLTHLADGRALLRRNDVPFVTIQAGGRTLPAVALDTHGERLVFGFADARYAAVLRIEATRSDLLVRLDEIRGPGITAVEFVRLAPSVDANIGSLLAVRSDEEISLTLVAGRETVETVANRGGLMVATVYVDPGLDGATAAIVVAPLERFATRMAETQQRLGLPSPRLDGEWAKESRSARRSYLFIDLSEANADEVIGWAKLGGFGTVLVYVRSWAASAGTYDVNRQAFPGGEAGLAATVRRLNAAGLRVGMHMLTSLVGRNDPLASPPDPRLLEDPTGRLVERHGSYLADLRTTLATEIAERIAGLVDRVGFDMIYMDAGEVNDANGPFWYWGGRQQQEILRRIRRPLLVQGSGTTAWTWHWFTRGTCDDGVAVGRDAWLEVQKIDRALPVYRRSRMPAELGWWPLYDARPGRAATTPAESWRLGSHLLALDVPVSVETTVESLRANPDGATILRTLARFEEARLTGGPPPPMPAAKPISCDAADTMPPSEVHLLDEREDGPVELDSPEPSAQAGVLGTRIKLARRASSGRRLVAALRNSPAALDVSEHPRMSIELQVDGPPLRGTPPAVMNLQLETDDGRYRDYLVDLDFRGGRRLIVDGPSADRVVRETSPTKVAYSVKRSLIDANLSRVAALNLRWMRGESGVRVRVRRIAALSAPAASCATGGTANESGCPP